MLLREYDAGQVVLQDLETKECRQTSDGELLQAIFSGQVLTREAALEEAALTLGAEALLRLQARGVTDNAIFHAVAKVQWINALNARGIDRLADNPHVRVEMKQLASGDLKDVKRFSIDTLYEAELFLRNTGGDVCSLVPRFDLRGGRGKWRIRSAALEILRDDLQARIDDEAKPRIRSSEVWNDVNVKIRSFNLAAPEAKLEPISESTVRRYVAATVPAEELTLRNLGRKRAQKVFRSNSGARDKATRPLEISEYDDVDSGVFTVDERNGLPWGRAIPTNGLDQGTWTVLGCDLSDKPRDFFSAVGAVCDSLRPKPDCLPGEMGYGAQGTMLFDNASYNAGKSMKHQSQAHKLLMSQAKPFGPTEKSCIEPLQSHD